MLTGAETMKGFFNPTSIAIIGASTNENTPGWAMARTALNSFKRGTVYFVNPKGGVLFGQPCHKKVEDIPAEKVDLGILIISARFVCDSVESLATKKNCKHQIVISGGFAEVDEAGASYQKRLVELCHKYGIRVIGPNCLGIYSPKETIDCLFIEGNCAARPKAGAISLGAQSGGFGTCMFNELTQYAPDFPWFGRLISFGNSCDVCEADLMEFFETDENTDVSVLYLEGFKQAKRFLESARRSAIAGKPVLVVKAGRNPSGSAALRSHSASLAADDAVTEDLFKQYGIIRCDGWKDMFILYSTAFSCKLNIPGKKIQILTNGGGQGVQIADSLASFGLELAPISKETHDTLKAKYKPFYIISNPLDLTGSGTNEEFIHTFKTFKDDPCSDALIINVVTYLSQIDHKVLLKSIIELFGKQVPNRKPVFVSLIGATLEAREQWKKELLEAGIPIVDNEVDAGRVTATVEKFCEFRRKELEAIEKEKALPPPKEPFTEDAKKEVSEILTSAQKELKPEQKERALLEHEAYGLLKKVGLPVPRFALCKTAEEAEKFVSTEFPDKNEREAARFVVKIVSPDVLHKSDVGGVEVNISSEGGAVGAAVERMMKKFTEMQIEGKNEKGEKTTHPCDVRGILVTEMVPTKKAVDAPRDKGVELIIGMNTDPTFGKVLLVGLGGILVEVLKDVSFGLCPLIKRDALGMIERLKSQKMLNGYRDLPAVDRSKLADLMVRVSQVAAEFPVINSIDFNPVIAGKDDLWIVDARIMVGK